MMSAIHDLLTCVRIAYRLVSKQYAHSCRIFDSLMQQSSVLSLHNLKRIARSVVMGLRSYEGERTSKLFFLCFSFSYVSTFSGGLINVPSMSDEFFSRRSVTFSSMRFDSTSDMFVVLDWFYPL